MKMSYLKYFKILLFTLFSALIFILCSSCCKTCLIANSELSDINTGIYKSWNNVTTITSNNKSIKIAPVNGGQIISYSFADNNVLTPINPPLPPTPRLLRTGNPLPRGGQKGWINQIDITPANKQSNIKFKDQCSYKVYRPNTVLLSNTIDSHYDLSFSQEYKMNLDNGDVFITQNLRNTSEEQKSLYLNNKTFLKSDAYIIIPLSVISKLPNRWCYLNSKAENSQTSSAHVFDDKLIFHASEENIRIGADPKNSWFAYISKDLLFIKKFSYGTKGKYMDNYTIKINSTHNSLTVETPSPLINLKPNENKTFTQKWTIIKLDKPVNSFDSAIKTFNLQHLHMLLNR
jgi:hypothetical protein